MFYHCCYRKISQNNKDVEQIISYTCSCCLENFIEKPLYECTNVNSKKELTCPKGYDSTYVCKNCITKWIAYVHKNSNEKFYNCPLCRNNTLIKNKENNDLEDPEEPERTNEQQINTKCSCGCYYNCIHNCNCTFNYCNNIPLFRDNKIINFLYKILLCVFIYIAAIILFAIIALIFDINTNFYNKWYFWIVIIPSIITGCCICLICVKFCDNVC